MAEVWGGVLSGYAMDLPIKLKAGQSISMTATVTGKDRKVSMALSDPTGTIIAATKPSSAIKSVQLTAEEVNANGKYMITVVSDRIGPFTLRVTGLSEDDLDIKGLEEEVQRLKQQLAQTEAKLEALKAKAPKNKRVSPPE